MGSSWRRLKRIYITGLIRDEHGEDVQSKGNVVIRWTLDGIALNDLVEAHQRPHAAADEGQDREGDSQAVPEGIAAFDRRAAFHCRAGRTSRDINFDLGRVGGNRNFCNKLWNASRFVLAAVENSDLVGEADTVADRGSSRGSRPRWCS